MSLPKLSQETLENIAVVVIRARDEHGLAVQLRLRDVLTAELLEQFPKEVTHGYSPCGGTKG